MGEIETSSSSSSTSSSSASNMNEVLTVVYQGPSLGSALNEIKLKRKRSEIVEEGTFQEFELTPRVHYFETVHRQLRTPVREDRLARADFVGKNGIIIISPQIDGQISPVIWKHKSELSAEKDLTSLNLHQNVSFLYSSTTKRLS